MSDEQPPGSPGPGDASRRDDPSDGSGRLSRDEILRRLEQPSDEVLREPTDRGRIPSDGRRRTVADLLREIEQRDGTTTPPAAPQQPRRPNPRSRPAPPAPGPTAPSADSPAPPRPPEDADRTETIPPVADPRPAAPSGTDRSSTPDHAETTTIPPVVDAPTADSPAPAPGGRRRRAAGPAVLPASGTRLAAADRRARRRRTATTGGRVVVALACVLSLVGTGFVWGYLRTTNGGFRTISAVNADDKNIRNKGAQTGDQTYLIVGTDTRAGQNGRVGAGTTAEADGARSDTVILVNVPANRSRVVAVSFPRDLAVDRPECRSWDNNTGTYGTDMVPAETGAKLNTAYGDGGPECAVKVIQQLSGLNINHFIAMDFFGFEQVVNKLGGVQVCSPTPLYDYELGQILSRPGKQIVRGSRALNYVRARTVESEGNGDYGRIKRQQLFMSSLLRSMLSGQVLSNPAKLNGIINTFIKYSLVDGIDTDSLLNLAQSLDGLQAGRVTFLTVPTAGTTTDGSNNEIPRTDDINAIFDAIINDDPLPGEQRAATPPSSSRSESSTPSPTTSEAPTEVTVNAQSPESVGVRVLNATGTTGLATRVSDEMSTKGFDVRGVADASQNQDQTVVRYGPGAQAAAATVAAMIPGAVIQPDRTVKSGVEVLLGSQFSGSLGEVPTQGSAVRVMQNPQSNETVELPNDLSVTNGADTSCNT
ncbi:LCP family protein [Williamsia serinedens]|uniref:Transcriptional attenuator, LytR family n=1 Tax=Williamsia serinedens TaxID=391736 RepID=A0ABT1H2T5_9NOCA|nr:LCP family protein [Williamsia serinedens]MCP2160975.1 transcriptional attenuator, LytR family [Williamsia serinedens]